MFVFKFACLLRFLNLARLKLLLLYWETLSLCRSFLVNLILWTNFSWEFTSISNINERKAQCWKITSISKYQCLVTYFDIFSLPLRVLINLQTHYTKQSPFLYFPFSPLILLFPTPRQDHHKAATCPLLSQTNITLLKIIVSTQSTFVKFCSIVPIQSPFILCLLHFLSLDILIFFQLIISVE